MKVIKLLSLWLLAFAMAISPMTVFGEEVNDDIIIEDSSDVGDEETDEESDEESDEELPGSADEMLESDLNVDYIPEVGTTEDPVLQQSTGMTNEEKSALREENKQKRSSQYFKISSALNSLGIYSFIDADQDSTVTRGEFAKMIIDLLGLEENYIANKSSSSDISGNLFENEINIAYSYGLMNGVGSSSFAPDDEITYMQAVKTIVVALGYGPIAETKGGYPEGYRKVAIDLKILKGTNTGFDEPITFLSAANLIALASETAILEPIGIEGNGIVYNNAPQKTVLAIYHDIYEDEGKMTDNGVSAIGKKSQVGVENTVIGGKLLFGMKNSYRDYLGCNVRYFYTTENGSDRLLYATTENINNNIVTIHASELLCDNSDFTARKIVAEIDGKKKSYNIHEYVDFMYNGAVDATFHNDSMKINSGYLTLIDANGDNVYELVKAWEYSDIVVNTVLVSDERVSAKYGLNEYSLIEYGKYNLTVFENANGEEITPDEILSGNVLSVFKSKDNTMVKFILSGTNEQIEVSSLDNQDTNIVVYYGESQAELSYSYRMLNKELPATYPTPAVGSCYSANFNYEGYISMMTLVDGREQYAYALAMAYGSGIRQNKVDIKLYFETNNWAVIPVANKITIDGVKNKTGADLMADTRIYKDGAIVPQLVKVTLNSKGELSTIWIDNEVDNSIYGFNLERFSLDYDSKALVSDITSSGYNNRYVARSYRVTPETKIFLTKEIYNNLEVTSEEEVRVITFNQYIGISGSKYVKMYDSNEAWQCKAMVMSEIQGISNRLCTIDKVSHITDEDGEDKISIACYHSGVYRYYREDDGGRLTDAVKVRYPDSNGEIYKGDVFEILLDINGEICNAKFLYSPKRDTDKEFCFTDVFYSSGTYTVAMNNQVYVLGYPLVIKDGSIGVYVNANPDYVPLNASHQKEGNEEGYCVHPIATSSFFLKYDCASGTLENIKLNDLYTVGQPTANGFEIYDKSTKIFFRKSSGTAQDVMIITNVGN